MEDEDEKKVRKPVKPMKVPAKPLSPVTIFMAYAKDKVKNSERSKELSTQVSRYDVQSI